MKLTFATIALVLTGCGSVSSVDNFTSHALKDDHILCENKPYSDDDLDTAALDVIYPQVRHFYFNADSVTPEMLADARDRVSHLTAWAKTVTNVKIRSAYLKWLSFYDDQYNEVADRINHPSAGQPSVQEQEHTEAQEKQARADALKECLPKPTEVKVVVQ